MFVSEMNQQYKACNDLLGQEKAFVETICPIRDEIVASLPMYKAHLELFQSIRQFPSSKECFAADCKQIDSGLTAFCRYYTGNIRDCVAKIMLEKRRFHELQSSLDGDFYLKVNELLDLRSATLFEAQLHGFLEKLFLNWKDYKTAMQECIQDPSASDWAVIKSQTEKHKTKYLQILLSFLALEVTNTWRFAFGVLNSVLDKINQQAPKDTHNTACAFWKVYKEIETWTVDAETIVRLERNDRLPEVKLVLDFAEGFFSNLKQGIFGGLVNRTNL